MEITDQWEEKIELKEGLMDQRQIEALYAVKHYHECGHPSINHIHKCSKPQLSSRWFPWRLHQLCLRLLLIIQNMNALCIFEDGHKVKVYSPLNTFPDSSSVCFDQYFITCSCLKLLAMSTTMEQQLWKCITVENVNLVIYYVI